MNVPKNNARKTLVRNTEKPLLKCKVTSVTDVPTVLVETQNSDPKDVAQPNKNASDISKQQTKFDSPKLCSTLKFSKKIDDIAKPRKTKSCSDVVNKKLAVDEKVSRRVNFPYSEPIYRDLIPLSVEQAASQPVLPSREPLPQKDKEAVLVNFIEPRTIPHYYSLPSVKIENKVPSVVSNNIRLYKLLELNDK